MVDTSASMEEKLHGGAGRGHPLHEDAASAGPGAGGAVQRPGARPAGLHDDHEALEKAIRTTEASGPTALHNALYVALKDLAQQKKAGELRRRAIVMLSDGEDTASLVTRRPGAGAGAEDRDQHLLHQPASQPPHGPQPPRLQPGGAPAERPGPGDGRARCYFPNSISELDSVYDRIAEELRTQYSLGYVSSNKRRDGKWRRIVVRVARARGRPDPPQDRLLRPPGGLARNVSGRRHQSPKPIERAKGAGTRRAA